MKEENPEKKKQVFVTAKFLTYDADMFYDPNEGNALVNISMKDSKRIDLRLEYTMHKFELEDKDYFEYQALTHRIFTSWIHNEYEKSHDFMIRMDGRCPLGVHLYAPISNQSGSVRFMHKDQIPLENITSDDRRTLEDYVDTLNLYQNNVLLHSDFRMGKEYIDSTLKYAELTGPAKKELEEWQRQQDTLCFYLDSILWRLGRVGYSLELKSHGLIQKEFF